MPATYDRAGLKFQYPENWEITDDTNDIPRTISLQSPTGAFWSVDIHPFSVDADDLLEQTIAAMKAEYEDLEVDPVEEQTAGEPTSGYDLTFYCLDFLVASQLRCFKHGHALYALTYQAEDRDFDKLHDVFRAITTSMLSAEPVTDDEA